MVVSHLYAGYGQEDILQDIYFKTKKGEFICILGANGCGKTTLLKSILGMIKPSSGKVTLMGDDIHKMDVKTLAQKIAYIPQAHVPPFPFKVRDVVLMGRTPYLGYFAAPQSQDKNIVDRILDMLGIAWMADRTYTKLSGGQRQMVLIARALAQEPALLIMDEPAASLDFGNQYNMLSRVINLSEEGMGVIMVTHDPDHAYIPKL
nr:ABC transporter ATP-binding protein [Dehalobacterium formicoaceticum]